MAVEEQMESLVFLQKRTGFVKFRSGGTPASNLTKSSSCLTPCLGDSVVVLFFNLGCGHKPALSRSI
jgi:hypothetical protein